MLQKKFFFEFFKQSICIHVKVRCLKLSRFRFVYLFIYVYPIPEPIFFKLLMSDYYTPFICKMNKLLSFLNFFKLLQKLVDERKESQRLREYIAELTSKILEHDQAILENKVIKDSKSQTKSAEAGKTEITMSKPITVAQRRDSKTDSKFNYKRLFRS